MNINELKLEQQAPKFDPVQPLDFSKHPLQVVLDIAGDYADESPVFKFQSYEVLVGDVYGDEYRDKVTLKLEGKDILRSGGKIVQDFLAQEAAIGRDVVLCSDVLVGAYSKVDGERDGQPTYSASSGYTMHIPMVDFTVPTDKFNPLTDADAALGEIGKKTSVCAASLDFYSSGRSYHAYGRELLTEEEWLNFMASLLLVNRPEHPELIDTRWVGHRLMQRSGALRFTKTSPKYLAFPKLLEYPAVEF